MTGFFRSIYDLLFRDLVRVYRLLDRRIRVSIWVLFGCMLVTAALECGAIGTLAFLGMSMASPTATAAHPIYSKVLKTFPALTALYKDPARFVFITSLAVLCIFAMKNAFQAFVAWRTAVIGESISLYLGAQILHRFLYSPYMWHISSDSVRMHHALGGKQYLSSLLIQLLNTHAYAITAIALFVTLLSATPNVVFLVMLGTATAAACVYRALKNRIDHAAQKANEAAQKQGAAQLNALNGIREVLIYRQQEMFHKAYVDACQSGASSRSFLAMAPPLPSWILETVGVSIIPLSVWLLAVQRGADTATLASVISLVLLTAWRILPMVNRSLGALISVRGARPHAITSIERLEEMRALPSLELPPPDPDFTLNNGVILRNVSFRYPTAKQDSLQDITLSLPQGRQIGFIGRSGAGKSTLAGIISGLMEPTSGELLVDDEPLDKPRLAAYMLRVGYVPQSPYILSGTVAENVAFSKWGQPIDEERVLRACRMASLDIVEKGLGTKTRVGERGVGLSGGQAQRVSLARALFCDPSILILDEATSSLDQANENAIMTSIAALRDRVITVIVAHRLSTIENCDYLYWLENGLLYGEGTPEEILPAYKEFMKRLGQSV